jgi:hypothetical protein
MRAIILATPLRACVERNGSCLVATTRHRRWLTVSDWVTSTVTDLSHGKDSRLKINPAPRHFVETPRSTFYRHHTAHPHLFFRVFRVFRGPSFRPAHRRRPRLPSPPSIRSARIKHHLSRDHLQRTAAVGSTSFRKPCWDAVKFVDPIQKGSSGIIVRLIFARTCYIAKQTAWHTR